MTTSRISSDKVLIKTILLNWNFLAKNARNCCQLWHFSWIKLMLAETTGFTFSIDVSIVSSPFADDFFKNPRELFSVQSIDARPRMTKSAISSGFRQLLNSMFASLTGQFHQSRFQSTWRTMLSFLLKEKFSFSVTCAGKPTYVKWRWMPKLLSCLILKIFFLWSFRFEIFY